MQGSAASIFDNLNNADKTSYENIKNALLNHFSPDSMNFIKRASFHQLKLANLDQLDSYFAEISDKGKQIDLTEGEKVQIFLNGLPPKITEHLILQQVDSLRTAHETDQLKIASLLSTDTDSSTSTLISKVDTLISTLKPNRLPDSIANDNGLSNDKEQKLQRQIDFLRNKIEKQSIHNHTSRYNNRTHLSYNDRPQRTYDARPICTYCHKPGYVACTCFKRNQDIKPNYNNTYSSQPTRNQYFPNSTHNQQKRQKANQQSKYFPRNNVTYIKLTPGVSVVSFASYKDNYEQTRVANGEHIPPIEELPQYLEGEIGGRSVYMLVDNSAAI